MAFTKEYVMSNDNIKYVHSTATGSHAVSVSDNFYSMKSLDGFSQSDALSNFLSESSTIPDKIIDDCEGNVDSDGYICNTSYIAQFNEHTSLI